MGLCYTFNGSDMFVENSGVLASLSVHIFVFSARNKIQVYIHVYFIYLGLFMLLALHFVTVARRPSVTMINHLQVVCLCLLPRDAMLAWYMLINLKIA